MSKVFLALAAISIAQISIAESDITLSELDAVWAELSRTVVEGDFEGMAAVYHEDAVLVNAISHASYPIASAMAGWKPDIERTKQGEVTASVEFRFSERLHDDTTAHETGMFYYSAKPVDGELTEAIIKFEALLVKKEGEWQVMMEYQKSRATLAQWQALIQ